MLDLDQNFKEKTHCLNCQEPIDNSISYCGNCGQKIAVKRLALIPIIKQAVGKLLDLDEGGIIHTFQELMSKPGEACRGYIRGKRKTLTRPVPYFIVPMVIYIFLSEGLEWSSIWNFFVPTESATLNVGEKYLSDAIKDQRLFIFSTVPTFSLAHLWLFRKSRLYYAEHLVFNLYTQGQVIILSIPLLILAHLFGEGFLSLVFIISFLYSVWVIKRFYQSGIIKALFAYTFGYIIYYVIIVFMIFCLFIYAEFAKDFS